MPLCCPGRGWTLREVRQETGGEGVHRKGPRVSVTYELGPFRLDPEAGMLTRCGMPTALGPRAVAVLNALVEHANEYVPKGRIIDAAWPDVVVEESNLSVQIAAIRRVLAQAGGEGWIETLARRGYRFVGPVNELHDRPAQRSPGAGACSNLPEPLTSFIGRERELVEIKRLLPGKRLLTLVGVGGIGKTRLALQAAGEVINAYRDGVWFAELGSIRDPSLVATAVAQALGVQERAGTPITESLRAHLKARQVLLVLDNCEHLLGPCASLVDTLLRGAADATIIATSREPLRVTGEQIYTLQPLSLPERGAATEMTARSEAIQLFVERVQRQLPDFALTAAHAPAVAELCIHLDGIPLALELAAARARSLSVEQINARLGDRFRLLTDGSRTALPRQRTLRATIDWSYDLLSEVERVVLRRLAIFPGSFSVDSASRIASDPSIDELAFIDLLSQLVARSLVIADTSTGRTRYRLLETTRAYALEKLTQVEEFENCRRRHAMYFCELFDHAPDDWLRMPDSDWSAAYLSELDNVRAALDWAFGDGEDSAVGTRLAGGSGPLWPESGLWNEGTQRLQGALAAVGPGTRPLDHARLWFWLANNQTPTEALPAFEHAVEAYRCTDELTGIGHSLLRAGAEAMYLGRIERAVALIGEAAPLLERAGLPKLLAEYFREFGTLKFFTGDLTGAHIALEKSAALCEQTGATHVAQGVCASLAEVAWSSGDLDAALTQYRQAVALARLEAMPTLIGMHLTGVAGVLVERGELDAALVAAREGLPLRQEFGAALWAFDFLALRLALKGQLGLAARIAGHADYGFTKQAVQRQPNDARARDRLQVLLREKLTPDELESLLAEGAQMSEDDACRLALEE